MSEAGKPPLEITCSRHFPAFLADEGLSLVFTTYQASKVFFIGLNGDRLSFHERTFSRCMGLARKLRATRFLPRLRPRPGLSPALCHRCALAGAQSQSLERFELAKNLERHRATPRAGLIVIDLASGDIVHWLRIEGVVQELFDVAVLPGVRRPMRSAS